MKKRTFDGMFTTQDMAVEFWYETVGHTLTDETRANLTGFAKLQATDGITNGLAGDELEYPIDAKSKLRGCWRVRSAGSTIGVTIESKFKERGQSEPWKNGVAKHLNVLLGRARYFQETSNDESDQEAELATLAIVQRVADFEEIVYS